MKKLKFELSVGVVYFESFNTRQCQAWQPLFLKARKS